MSTTLAEFQRKFLILLVGTNPLPNYVAAMLLVPDEGHVILLATQTTAKIAENLERVIKRKRPSLSTMAYEIDDNDGALIEKRTEEILQQAKVTASVGLHYTGGTKPMSTHTHHAITRKFSGAICSYLDALKLEMVIDARGSEPGYAESVRTAVAISFADLFDLHGYTCNKLSQTTGTPPSLYHALAEVHRTQAGFNAWRKYLSFPNENLETDEWDFDLASVKSKRKRPELKQLPTHADEALEPFVVACEELAQDAGVALTPEFIAQQLRQPNLEKCRQWFIGTWLEEFALDVITEVMADLKPTEVAFDLRLVKSNPPDFQLDLAAIYGYQLFAISCIATEKKAAAKEHLFEVLARAVQLGGDEARLALFTCRDNTDSLAHEIGHIANVPDRVLVLGRKDLENKTLKRKLKAWFIQADKPKEQKT